MGRRRETRVDRSWKTKASTKRFYSKKQSDRVWVVDFCGSSSCGIKYVHFCIVVPESSLNIILSNTEIPSTYASKQVQERGRAVAVLLSLGGYYSLSESSDGKTGPVFCKKPPETVEFKPRPRRSISMSHNYYWPHCFLSINLPEPFRFHRAHLLNVHNTIMVCFYTPFQHSCSAKAPILSVMVTLLETCTFICVYSWSHSERWCDWRHY